MKVLLLRLKRTHNYALPGGFVQKNETVESAASRVLKERTGLDNIFLKQFKVFSDPDRSKANKAIEDLFRKGLSEEVLNFFSKRFISIGFFNGL